MTVLWTAEAATYSVVGMLMMTVAEVGLKRSQSAVTQATHITAVM